MTISNQEKNLKKYVEFLGTQSNFRFEKICHEIIYSVDGKCPHCNKEIKSEKIEKFSDNINESYKNYKIFLDNWLNKKKEHLSIISQVKWKTTYLVSGLCPYCNEFISSSYEGAMSIDNPIYPDIIEDTKNIHTLIKCPKCNKYIHSVGFVDKDTKRRYYKFCTSDECKVPMEIVL